MREIEPGSPEYEQYAQSAAETLGMADEDGRTHSRFFDITIMYRGAEVQPSGAVRVEITLLDKPVENLQVVHAHEDEAKEITSVEEVTDVEVNTETEGEVTASFESESFSVFGVVYTVDFVYSVNGKTYDFRLPGGGFITLHQLMDVLGIDEETKGAGIDRFVADIKNVEFSDSSLVWVGKAGQDSTIGQVKSACGLDCEYSNDLTEEQIEEINNTEIAAGEWLLISLKPFTSEETLTVTMNDGEVFTVKVTDAQEIPDAEATSIDVNKSYLICYEVGGTYYLLKNDGTVDSAYHPDFDGDTDSAHDFEHLNSSYAWSFSHIFKEKDVQTNLDKNYYLIRPIDNKSRTIALNNAGEAIVQEGNNNVAVIQSGDGFILEGYHNLGTEEEPRYVHLGFNGSNFVGVDGDGVTVHIYEMDSLPTYDYTVRSADEIRGTVTVSDGTIQNVIDEGIVVAHYYDVTSTADKKNGGTITATPVTHRDTGGRNKWEFDHWELDGLPLDRNQYPATIQAEALSIPHNGSQLVAYFRQNRDYVVPPNEKEPSSIEDMTGWLEGLQSRNIPLESSATKKTAEVFDYENRIYRVDFTSRANFQTFAGNLDMAFCLDVSNSMYFPSALVEAETNYNGNTNPIPIYQINNSGWGYDNRGWLDRNRDYNNPYYLIADASGTATVFKIYYKEGNWRAIDASRTGEYENGTKRYFIIGQEDFSTNYGQDARHPFSKGDNNNTTYTIYNAGDNGNNRFVYLNQSLSGSSTDLNTISGLLAVAGDASPGVKIAYNTFNKDLGGARSDFQPASSGLTVSLNHSSGGGTRPDQAFNDAQNFSWSADYTLDGSGNLVATDRYVILVTDGAPQGLRTGEASDFNIEQAVRTAATNLKNNSHVKLITVGLSMDSVTSGKRLLYDLADYDINGNKMFYMAEKASDLTNIFRQITKVLMEDVVVLGDITDTAGEAFYLVDKATGMPLGAGNTIDIEGNLTTNTSEVAGVVQEDGRTIKWLNQPIDSIVGWHGTVYVKAKEDLIGANAAKTNDGEATIVATRYRAGGKDVDFDTTLVRDTLNLRAELPSPRVNVNELSFPKTETEWTVYLGTEVDPQKQLKKFYEEILVEEVVNEDGSLHYTLSPNDISDDREGETSGTAATFPLAPVILQHMISEGGEPCQKYLTTESGNTVLNWDEFLKDILNGGVTVPYHPYGIEGAGSNIVITLEKNVEFEGSDPIPKHETDTVGNGVETYTLTVRYNPDYTVTPVGQGGQSTEDFHTGTYGTMYQGHAAGRETSTNEHVINVYNVPLDVYKTNEDDDPLSGATFKLYKVDDENGEIIAELDSNHTYVEVAAATSGADGIARLKHNGDDFGLVLGETYYLIETAAPANYTKVNTVWAVEVQTEIGKFTDLDGEVIYSTITPDSESEPPVVVGTGVTDDMYLFNWDQGARIMLDGKEPVLVIAKGETEGTTTEITDGSFVSHEKAISFRHTVLNLIGGTVNINVEKTWDDNNDPNRPDSVTVTLYRVSDKDHVWGEGVVVPSACTTEGNKQYTCSECGETKTEAISVAGHKPGTAHTENDVAATCTADGGYDTVVRCMVCNAIISSVPTSIDALGHIPEEAVQENYVAPTYTADGGYDEVVYCTRCGEELSRTHVTIPRLVNPNHTVTINFKYRARQFYFPFSWYDQDITSRTGTGAGDLTITWRWDDNTYPQSFTVEGLGTSSYTTSSSGNNVGAQQTLTISNITTDLTINVIISNSGYSGTNDGLIGQPTFSGRSSRAAAQAVPPSSLLSTRSLSEESLMMNVNAAPLRSRSTAADPVMAYLDTVPDTATCAEGENHAYKEVVGTYTISRDSWTLPITGLPMYNEYGKQYTYYVVETPLTGYEITYSGQDSGLQDGGSATITNRKQVGSLKITKAVTVDDATTDTSSLTNGTYVFSITGADTATAGISHTVSITFESGRATGYAIDSGAVQPVSGTDNTWSVVVPNLVPGSYTISETDSGNLVLKSVTGGSSISENVATVTVTDQDTSAETAAAQVVFTNNIETVSVGIIKQWEHGTNTNLPTSLTVHLSNGESRTLDESNGWSAAISGLPKYDHSTGELIVYSWTEESLPAGYYLSSIGETTDAETGVITTTITNAFTNHYVPETTIQGVKIWDDDGSAGRPSSITVNLYKDGETTPYRTTTVTQSALEGANPDEWPFEFTNLPIFNDDGSIIQYRVEEVLPEGYVSDYRVKIEFTPATYVAGEITGEVITSGQGSQTFDVSKGVDLGYIVIKHGNNFIVWAPRRPSSEEVEEIRQKVKDLSNDFSDIISVNSNHIYYQEEEPHTPHTIQVIWGVPKTINVGPKPAVSFSMDGDTVRMTFLNPEAWSAFCYGKIPYTYTPAGGEGGGTITNVKKVVDISGTKTWVDRGRLHDNGQEITLTLKRTLKPVSETSKWVTVDAEPTWSGNTYTFSGLDRYQNVNDPTTEYAYKVEETNVYVMEGEGESQQRVDYASESDGNDFTNTEVTTVEATKTWKDGELSVNATVTNASVTFELQRKNGDGSWSAVPQTADLTNPVTMAVGDTANESTWKATWRNLPKYEMIDGTPTAIQYRVFETAATLQSGNLTPGDPAAVTFGQPTNIDNYLPVDLIIVKVDSTNMTTPLPNAQFILKELDPEGKGTYLSGGVEKTSGLTDAEGRTSITGIAGGYYEISETKVPDGYVLIDSGKLYIRVANGETTLLTKDANKAVTEWAERTLSETEKLRFDADNATFTVGNTPGAALPSTGGSGTNLYYLLGTMLIALAGAALVMTRRRKNG